MAVIARSTAAQAAPSAIAHPAHELVLAKAACARSLERIRSNFAAVMRGKANGDAETVAIAKDVLGAGHCLSTHPLRV
jgi:hypothetical protein